MLALMLVFLEDFVFVRNKSFLCVRLPLAVLPCNWEQFKSAGGTGAAARCQCPFQKAFLVYPLHLKLLTYLVASAHALQFSQKMLLGVLSKTGRK